MIAAIHTSIINQHSVAVRQVIIVWIGSISFGIYLMHFFVLSAIVARLPITDWALRASLTLLLTALLIVTLQKVLPKKLHKYLGI